MRETTGCFLMVKISPSNLKIDTKSDTGQFHVGIALHSVQGFEIASWTDKCSDVELPARHGMNTVRLAFPHLKLLPGHYYLDIGVWGDRGEQDRINGAVQFEITPSPRGRED